MQTIASAYEDEDDTAEESKAKAVSVIASVEDLIAANSDWADFADLFKEFKTVPSASEYIEEMDELVEAIAADESSDDEIEDENTSETVITPNSVEALVRDYKQNGRKPSQNPAFVESARKNFFDDEAEAEN
jgi:hypothetical protein